MKKCLSLLTLLLLCMGGLSAQTVTGARFVNTGKMNVAGTMYVTGHMQMVNPTSNTTDKVVSVVHSGTTVITGDFYHDAVGNVFKTGNDDFADKTKPRGVSITSTGTIKFSGTEDQKITSSTITTTFNRVKNYIAFPNIIINTDKNVIVPPKMGLDARTIALGSGKKGKLHLESAKVGTEIYDASLRVIGHNGSYTVADGAVVIEKQVAEFRETDSSKGSTIMLMPFASPFTNMRSVYFAGNWVRYPQIDTDKNSFRYPYANKDSDRDTYIDWDQYIISPDVTFKTGAGYLIRLQKTGTDFDELNLGVTAGASSTLPKFTFDGEPYGLTKVSKKLFAGDNILSQQAKSGKNYTQNWVVGNSYTSAISGQAIADKLMGPAEASYVTDMYIYHHGATGYTTYPMWDGSKIADNIPAIQAMSVFMIAVDRNNTKVEDLTIGPEYQVHAGGISSTPSSYPGTILTGNTKSAQKRATAETSNELALLLTPSENPFVYDRTSIKLSDNADLNYDYQDVSKLQNKGADLFQIYGTNNTGAVLQQNALPHTAEKALLSVSPASAEMTVTLTAENADEFVTEVLELYDTKTKQTYDLKLNNEYTFTLLPGDNADRFELRFTRSTTGLDEIANSDWYAYTSGNELIVKSLTEANLNSQAGIYGAAGVLHLQQEVNNVPEQRINISSLPAGVYMLTIQGKTVKFVK